MAALAGGVALALLVAGCQTSSGLTPMAVSAARPACTDVIFPIYFAEGSDQLTPTAAQVIGAQAAVVHGCRIGLRQRAGPHRRQRRGGLEPGSLPPPGHDGREGVGFCRSAGPRSSR